MKKVLYTTITLLIISWITFIYNIHNQKVEMTFKPDLELQESVNREIKEIKLKQDEIIKTYDLIISNRISHCEK